MSKNDIPFHKVIMNFVSSMQMPKEIGIHGLSYSYGGSNICFHTNASFPIISVLILLFRKEEFIVYLSFFHFKPLSISLKPFFFKKMLSLFRNPKLSWAMQLKPSCLLFFPSGGKVCSFLYYQIH